MSEERAKCKKQQKKETFTARISVAKEEGTLDSGDPARIFDFPSVLDFDSQIRLEATDDTTQFPGSPGNEIVAIPGAASRHLLNWPRLTGGMWIERSEQSELIRIIDGQRRSFTVLPGAPGSGKSALLAQIANELTDRGVRLLALKADHIPVEISTLTALDEWLDLPLPLVEALQQLSASRPVVLSIDQIDALAELMDLRSSRLTVVLSLIRKLRGMEGIHIVLSCREFEFRHDLRLSSPDPATVRMTDPSWEEAGRIPGAAGIDGNRWPPHARELLRRPQYPNFFISHFSKTQPRAVFDSYNAMIEAVPASGDLNVPGLECLATVERIAVAMAEDENLEVAKARFDRDHGQSLARLEALDLIVFDESRGKLAFRHQTIFDFVRSRTFAAREISLSEYVFARQDALFLRPSLWSALHYLRQAGHFSYVTEFQTLWTAAHLRRHVRSLLLEYPGQLPEPDAIEAVWFLPLLDDPEMRPKALRAMQGSPGWFRRARTRFVGLMTANEQDAWRFSALLQRALEVTREEAVSAVELHWLPSPRWDPFVLSAFFRFKEWDERTDGLIEKIVRRSPALHADTVEHVAVSISKKHPEPAVRIVAARLWGEFEQAEATPVTSPPLPPDASETDQIVHEIVHSDDAYKSVRDIVSDSRSWYKLDQIAAAAPAHFVENVMPWVIHVAGKYGREGHDHSRFYLHDPVFEMPGSERYYQHTFMLALVAAIRGFAKADPPAFLVTVGQMAGSGSMVVHQLVAEGLAALGKAGKPGLMMCSPIFPENGDLIP